jgi:hypothetical protein
MRHGIPKPDHMSLFVRLARLGFRTDIHREALDDRLVRHLDPARGGCGFVQKLFECIGEEGRTRAFCRWGDDGGRNVLFDGRQDSFGL